MSSPIQRIRSWFMDGVPGSRPTWYIARWLFLRALAAVYLIAFVSLWIQIIGLVGHRGILPAEEFLQLIRSRLGPERFWLVPTLCWLNPSDAFLHLLCGIGSCAALLLLCDLAPVPLLILLWAVYLSLVTVCRDFLGFQWDNLLLEAGFLAIALAPLRLRPHLARASPPSPIALWLCRWLLFRLMFSSGLVKLLSGDATWRHLTALTYHYETQPLPTWMSWYAHHLPMWFHQASCLAMFIIELGAPWLIFGPRRARGMACGLLVGLQLLILATGNYCFFNLLALALCLLLIDDAMWPQRMRSALEAGDRASATARPRRWPVWMVGPIAAILVASTTVQMGFRWRMPWAVPFTVIERFTAPFRTTNAYGLFAVMTTTRPEIILEGSRDGEHWRAYEFPYKPGEVHRRPRFVAPHQPRLDWQMWFAALGSYRDHPWFLSLCDRILRGSPDVLALLASDPFPDAPPRYLRAVLYTYSFTDAATRKADGAWWRREFEGLYCPVLSLRDH